MEKAAYWAFGAACAGTLVALTLSLYLTGPPGSFLAFFARSLAVIGVSFLVVFAVAFRRASVDG
ncbi:hypothetical protein [Halobaculum sp. D14]|uniref:hypothetical protein n=1 Tax=unclassified Halobaculum TaxID=2640896 RepID=UPI003EBD452A